MLQHHYKTVEGKLVPSGQENGVSGLVGDLTFQLGWSITQLRNSGRWVNLRACGRCGRNSYLFNEVTYFSFPEFLTLLLRHTVMQPHSSPAFLNYVEKR